MVTHVSNSDLPLVGTVEDKLFLALVVSCHSNVRSRVAIPYLAFSPASSKWPELSGISLEMRPIASYVPFRPIMP